MALVDEEERRRAERAHQVALFRYQLIREAADPALSPGQRGAMVRRLAATTHTDPFGWQITAARGTLDRWLRNWREAVSMLCCRQRGRSRPGPRKRSWTWPRP